MKEETKLKEVKGGSSLSTDRTEPRMGIGRSFQRRSTDPFLICRPDGAVPRRRKERCAVINIITPWLCAIDIVLHNCLFAAFIDMYALCLHTVM